MLVSVVLPTYKRAHMLRQAMRSVLDQTYSNLELIVVDDNSPDNTGAVVAEFNDARIRYVKNDPNLKLPRALNRGFALAKGDLLTWTSDDNLLAPAAISKMVAALTSEDCDLVYADYWLFSEQDNDGKPLSPEVDRLPDRLQLEKGNHIGACFLYTRRLYEVIGDYDPELFLVEDYDYFIRASKSFRFFHIDEPLYYFRRDDDTLYLSRFPLVKASDVLVRLKHGLITENQLVDTVVNLIMRKKNGLTQPIFRMGFELTEGRFYWLSRAVSELARQYLRGVVSSEVLPILAAARAGTGSFRETRDALAACMQRHGRIEY